MQKIVILGTGGTIAGRGDDPRRDWAYQAAQLSVADLIRAVPDLSDVPLEVHQVAQIDSKDMSWAIWQSLAQALAVHLSREDVAGVVITHGTDTLEETAWLLHALHDDRKPIVLTAAMRPATSAEADGPANLADAVAWVGLASARQWGGVVAMLNGQVWDGARVRKSHSHALNAFDAGGEACLAHRPAGAWMSVWRHGESIGDVRLARPSGSAGWDVLNAQPPQVCLVNSHADADAWVMDALLAYAQQTGERLAGLVVVGTGHGTVHEALLPALARAQAQGVVIWRSARTARGGVTPRDGDAWRGVPDLTAGQARVALTLSLMGINVPL